MIPTLTSLQVVNRALIEIAQGVGIASGTVATNFDGSPNGIYAASLYQGAVQMLLRQQDYEFAREQITLTGYVPAGFTPWAFAYVYPTNTVRIRQLIQTGFDPNDPQPVRWDVMFDGSELFIGVNVECSEIIVTSSNAGVGFEGIWDDMFTEQMVRYLGSQLAIPVAGRPDFSEKMLDWSGKIGGAAMDRDS